MNFQEILTSLKVLSISKTNKIPYIEGEAGIGKSALCKKLVEELNNEQDTYNYILVTLFGSLIKEGELGGIPIPFTNSEGDVINTYTTHEKLSYIQNKSKENSKNRVILFVDELNRSDLAVQQELMQLLLEKKINQTELPKNTFIISAGNPDDSTNTNYQTNVMNDALIDRLTIFNMQSEVENWLSWAEKVSLNTNVIEFIANNPELLHTPNAKKKIKPTPRSWEAVSNNIEAYNDIKNKLNIKRNLLPELISGDVGTNCASMFIRHLEETSNPIISFDSICKGNFSLEKIQAESSCRIYLSVNRALTEFRKILKTNDISPLTIKNFVNFLSMIPSDKLFSFMIEIKEKNDKLYELLMNNTSYVNEYYKLNARIY